MSLRLTVRMAAPSIAISLLLLALGSIGGWYVHRLQRSTAALVALDMSTIRAVRQFVFGVAAIRAELADFLISGERAHLQAIPQLCTETEECLTETERLVDDPDEIALAGRVRDGYRAFREKWRQIGQGEPEPQTRAVVRQLSDAALEHDVLAPANELLAMEEQLVRRSSDHNLEMGRWIASFFGMVGGCGAVAGLVAGFGIARSVSRSIVKLYLPIRVVSGKLEEVIGPVDVAPEAGIEHLDALLHRVADQVGTVVDRLQQSQTEMLRSEQMAALGQLAAGLAHELRNPLTSMKMLIQGAVEAGPAASLAGRDLNVLHVETARLERSIQAFLDFARPPRLEKQRRDLREAVRQTLDLVAARAKQQGIVTQCDLPERPLLLEADHEQLRQVFLNLVLNAVDAQPNGGRVKISMAESLSDGQAASWASITVADQGPGIAAEIADRIFTPYASTKETGLGLGLAICRRIVEDHGGEITVTRAQTGGAVFLIRLPTHSA